MIGSLLIANRGEIACRVIRTAKALGIRTVAVYSDADAKALHVRQADEAVHIGAPPARESYLRGDRIIAAALATGAEAIHPGYGFLSENADFAQAVIDAGLVWVGPKPASIRAMGLKDAAKRVMMEAGVPTTPGYLGDDQSPERLRAEADAIGYPVLIKAVAGGGGKGMRQVHASDEFPDALLSCKREAASSFGDDRVLLEKYILSPRHIEVQVFGDSHGQVVHLFERDCSLQRRHQKVIEEAPAPGMDEATRAAVCGAAVRAAKAVDYEGAGTIEFIADASEGLRADRIWFMEMNTRLQVEHPVTEEITGVDLVEWQLRVASGEPLPKRQDELSINGWAIEARLYAEDPAKEFLPSVGRLTHLRLALPEVDVPWLPAQPDATSRPRVDTGVAQGSSVTSFYDPMIAKLIVHAVTRDAAAAALEKTCAEVQVWPVRSNAAFLARLATDDDFRSGQVDTGLIGRKFELLTQAEPITPALATTALSVLRQRTGEELGREWPIGDRLDGFRMNAAKNERFILYADGESLDAALPQGNPWADEDFLAQGFLFDHEGAVVFEKGVAHLVTLAYRPGSTSSTAADGAILSPMPGRVTAVEVAAGDRVAKGQKLVTLEAMKMEHSLVAPFDGTVAKLDATAGAQVSEGKLLARVEREG